jgi:hypothetical protein
MPKPSIWKHRKWFADKGELGAAFNPPISQPEFEHRVKWLGEGSLMYHLSQFESPYYGPSGSPEEKKLYKEFMEYVLNSNMSKTKQINEKSVLKKMKDGNGKATFDGPKVKDRKKFAPVTKVEKPKKGKGAFNRKNAFDEEEEKKGFENTDQQNVEEEGYGALGDFCS